MSLQQLYRLMKNIIKSRTGTYLTHNTRRDSCVSQRQKLNMMLKGYPSKTSFRCVTNDEFNLFDGSRPNIFIKFVTKFEIILLSHKLAVWESLNKGECGLRSLKKLRTPVLKRRLVWDKRRKNMRQTLAVGSTTHMADLKMSTVGSLKIHSRSVSFRGTTRMLMLR